MHAVSLDVHVDMHSEPARQTAVASTKEGSPRLRERCQRWLSRPLYHQVQGLRAQEQRLSSLESFMKMFEIERGVDHASSGKSEKDILHVYFRSNTSLGGPVISRNNAHATFGLKRPRSHFPTR